MFGVDLLLVASPPASDFDYFRLQLHCLRSLLHLVEVQRIQQNLRDKCEDDDCVTEVIGAKARQLIIDQLDDEFVDVGDLLYNIEAAFSEDLSVIRKVIGQDSLR